MRSSSILYFISLVILISLKTNADYRAYNLLIENKKTGATRTFKSTLDHLQYKTLYILNSDEQISYVSTWRCRGNTHFYKAICPSP